MTSHIPGHLAGRVRFEILISECDLAPLSLLKIHVRRIRNRLEPYVLDKRRAVPLHRIVRVLMDLTAPESLALCCDLAAGNFSPLTPLMLDRARTYLISSGPLAGLDLRRENLRGGEKLWTESLISPDDIEPTASPSALDIEPTELPEDL